MPRDDAINWMWPEACAMLARAERLHRQFFHVTQTQDRELVWEPPVDVLETQSGVFVVVGLPGVDPDTVGVGIEGDALIVVGDRSLPIELSDAVIHRLELPHGRFVRNIPLPRGRYGDAQCESANGCLIITLSKIH